MAEDDKTTGNGNDAGQQSDGGQSGDQTQTGQGQDKAFTQADVDRLISERLNRERDKFKDYDDLKAAAAEWQKHQDAQKSEMEKLQDKLNAAEKERDEARTLANDRLINAAIVSEASKAGFANPADAIALIDASGISLNDDGNVQGVEDAIKKLAEEKKYLLGDKTKAPSLNGGAGDGSRPGSPQLSDEELAIAKKMGLKPEDYLKYKTKE